MKKYLIAICFGVFAIIGAVYFFYSGSEKEITQKEVGFHVYEPVYIPENFAVDPDSNFLIVPKSVDQLSVLTVYKSRDKKDSIILTQTGNTDVLDLKNLVQSGMMQGTISVNTAKDKNGLSIQGEKNNKLTFITPDNVQVTLGSSDSIDISELVKIAESIQ